jgi:hypothetical protein
LSEEISQEEQDRFDWEDLKLHVRIGVFAVPVAAIFGVVVVWFVSLVTGLAMPRIPFGGLLFVWMWMNGALISAVWWTYKRGRFPITRTRWLEGDEAHRATLNAARFSLANMLLPAMIVAGFHFLVGWSG